MSRFLSILLLTVGLLLAGCAPPESQTEGAGNGQRADEAAKE